jgi:serine/threonine protein phosphatase 1
MAFIYAMSDIHGCYEVLEETLKIIDLSSDRNNKLIFCGDYPGYGMDSRKVLYRVKELTESYPDQVYALMGNHEQMFLDFLVCPKNDIWNFEWLEGDKGFRTVTGFVARDTMDKINALRSEYRDPYSLLTEIAAAVKEDIAENHSELIRWMKKLPYFRQTENQIFVHAGVDEEAEEYWMHGSSGDCFTGKYPATLGKFCKDIIAGHISAASIAGDPDFRRIFWDKQSHFYIDGDVITSGNIPVLKYDTNTQKYSGFEKLRQGDTDFIWREYAIT